MQLKGQNTIGLNVSYVNSGNDLYTFAERRSLKRLVTGKSSRWPLDLIGLIRCKELSEQEIREHRHCEKESRY